MTRPRAEMAQVALLSRHFFGRMFRNETVDFEDQMKEKLFAVLALLAVFMAWASWLLLFKYHFVADIDRSWQEKAYVLTLMMLIFAVVTLLEWDVLFPDRQDFLNLTPLPVRLRTVFAAKLVSFVLFVATFSAAMMSFSALLFSLYLTQWRADTVALGVRYVAAHLLAGFAANFAVFFAVVFLQFVLMAVLPAAVYKRASFIVRFALVAGLVFLLLSFVVAPSVLGGSFRALESLKDSGDPFVFRFPPLWFVGFYEFLLGTTDEVFLAQARTAGLATLLSLAAFAAAAGLSYRRHVRKTLEVRKPRPAAGGTAGAWRRLRDRAMLRTGEERAVYDFFAATLRASPRHRMSLIHYLAFSSAVVLVLVASNRVALRDLSPRNGLLLILPLILALGLVAGVRVLADRPAALEARWVFRLTETARPERYVRGLKKAIVARLLLPLFLAVFGFHALFWGAVPAVLHALFGLVVAALVMEAAFFRYQKVPFACPWVPGRFKPHYLFLPVSLGLLFGLATLAVIEKAVLAAPSRGAVVLAVAAAAALALWQGNRRFYRSARLRFDDAPEAALIELRAEPDA